MSEISKKQPKQLAMLFFAEMWERFSFYGMRALLILFMVKEFLYSDENAYHVYAAYGALVYTTPFIGGLLADKILGNRKAVMFGGILMAIGHFVMAGPDFTPEGPEYQWLDEIFFYTALAFLIVGNGFFKPNISSIVGSLYEEGDPRRDAGFTIFYMGVNLGAFLAPLLCGTIGELFGWSYGFGLAGIGMLLGLLVFYRGQDSLEHRGMPPSEEAINKPIAGVRTELVVYITALLFVPVAAILVNFHEVMSTGLLVFGAIVLIYLLYIMSKIDKIERERMYVILVLLIFSTMFWAFFEQAGSSITLFTDRNVDRMGLPTSIFQSVNPMFILLFAPIFSAFWIYLGKRDLSVPTKFALGIFQLGLGFGAFVLGASMASENGMISLFWLLLGYLLHTTGELCLSPVGLSMVTKLSPKNIVAMVMGAWFLSSAFAHNVGGIIAGLTSTSVYMESAVKYSPALNISGDETLKFKAYKPILRDKKSSDIIFLGKEEAFDSTKHVHDTLRTAEVTVNVHIVENAEQLQANYKPQNFILRRSIRVDSSLKMNARIKHLDPNGDLTNITMINTASNGQTELKEDQLTYTPNKNFSGQDTILYSMCEKEKGDICDNVQIIVTVDNILAHNPIVEKSVVDHYAVMSSTFSKNDFKINILNLVADPDGGDLSIEFTKKPELEKALVSESSNLNAFVTSRKTIHIYTRVFYYIMIFAVGASLILFLLVPFLKKWMHGVK